MKRLLSSLKDLYPIILCDGYFGVGKATSFQNSTPYFIAKTFEKDKEEYFQPQYYFKAQEMPFLLDTNSLVSTEEFPSRESFIETVETFKNSSFLEKVVLARKRIHTFTNPLTTSHILSLLTNLFPSSDAFAYIQNKDHSFFGSSPENLYKRDGDFITVDCIAGTATSGSKDELFTEKNIKEQQFVTSCVIDCLGNIADNICKSELGTKKAKDLIHLHQIVTATLFKGIDDKKIIDTLHPTPATLGYPKQEASTFLKKYEKFDRGLYAGCLGWISTEKAIIKVAIRSATVEKNTLTLFAGAGIIEESIPEKEIEEIGNKFNTLEGVFLENTMSNQ